MFEVEIRSAVCKVICSDDIGTGFLIAEDKVLTARHCVLAAIEDGARIALEFLDFEGGTIQIEAKLKDHSEESDASILELAESVERRPLSLFTNGAREGNEWLSFGFPRGKPLNGHRATGIIEAVQASLTARVDIDLSVATSSQLSDYSGMSGGPLLSGAQVVGMLRLRFDMALAAISVRSLEGFLRKNGINSFDGQPTQTDDQYALREEFRSTFENAILTNVGRYLFLEGPNGIGKTTFCKMFSPDDRRILNAGAYCIRDGVESNPNANSRASSLFDWLASSLSTAVTGHPSRREQMPFEQMVEKTSHYLDSFSQFCAAEHKVGVLFIDGLNEALLLGEQRLNDLVGLLPARLPENVVIVFSAPSYSLVSHCLGGRLDDERCIRLPPLETDATRAFTYHRLIEEKRNDLALVNAISHKSSGHPLYLNYLIRYVNQSESGEPLADFPSLDGPIEQYYEQLWQGLLQDAHVTNLLGIISRLREGVSPETLHQILNVAEQGVFSSTIVKVQHLFLDRELTAIYHDSFRVFVVAKTSAVNLSICRRLAEFCVENKDERYCKTNLVFHLSQSDASHRKIAVNSCVQDWVDACAELSVAPDTLIEDIELALGCALDTGDAVSSVRILLLRHRVLFRYDTLFAQSATLVAKAFAALGRPAEALSHIFRYDQIIVGIDEAIEIAWCLMRNGHEDEAIEVLEAASDRCIENYSSGTIKIGDFIELSRLHLICVLLLRVTERNQLPFVAFIQRKNLELIAESLGDADPALLDYAERRLMGVPNEYFLTFCDVYTSNSVLLSFSSTGNESAEALSPRLLDMRLDQLVSHVQDIDAYGISKTSRNYDDLLANIESTIPSDGSLDRHDIEFVIDALIEVNANTTTILRLLSQNYVVAPSSFVVRDANGVDADIGDFHREYMLRRINAYSDEEAQSSVGVVVAEDDWEQHLRNVATALATVDGKSRRAFSTGDTGALDDLWEMFNKQFLNALDYPLASRIGWRRAYAIPECFLPVLLRRAADLVFECHRNRASEFLQWLIAGCERQLGVYSEGFRSCLYQIIDSFSRHELESEERSQLFELLSKYREHCICGVENRHELVPELLSIIRLLVAIGANEEARNVGRDVLRFSMGPTWYKEDQFALLSTAVKSIRSTDYAADFFPKFAAVLERACGEMTFQRFIRYEKSNLIGLLVERGRLRQAVEYFKMQSCGDTQTLVDEIRGGRIDTAGDLGNRHPGGAIDEQEALLRIVAFKRAPWQLQWALLEVFQIGDTRHISSFAERYAAIVNDGELSSKQLQGVRDRIQLIAHNEVPVDCQWEFKRSFLTHVVDSQRQFFEAAFSEIFEPQNTGPPIVQSGNSSNEASSSSPDRELFFPGVFGKQEAFNDAAERIEAAEQERSLGNSQVARTLFREHLAHIQNSDWSIWERADSTTTAAHAAIQEICVSEQELIDSYKPLVLGEKNASSWVVADYLISASSRFFEDEHAGYAEAVLEHLSRMVGDVSELSERFEFLSKTSDDDNEALFDLLIWAAMHPNWIRREKAGELLLWLATAWDDALPFLVKNAFGTESGFGADIACGVLEFESELAPQSIWHAIENQNIEFDSVSKHFYRANFLRHILGQVASSTSSGQASELFSKLSSIYRQNDFVFASTTSDEPPYWAACIEERWKSLDSLGIVSQSLLDEFTRLVSDRCAPFSIDEVFNIESAVCRTFYEPPSRGFNRWTSRVLDALNDALCGYVKHEEAEQVRNVLRVVNPCLPTKHRGRGREDSFKKMRQAIISGDIAGAMVYDNKALLHYLEFGRISERSPMNLIEVVAVTLLENDMKRRLFAPSLIAEFSSRQLPCSAGNDHETCARVNPEMVFFGSLTPAFPLQSFLDKYAATSDDCERRAWVGTRSSDVQEFGQSDGEGCSLTIKSAVLDSRNDLKLGWIVLVNGEVAAVVDSDNNQLF
ncbi:serine protease [Stieleria sp. TO1_6]|uniref:AVAST type 1 anti-phage system protease Avs1b n=1 Tax=Stieleria tagensis TaxID=2956795 RepID=UPI00209B3B9E|nr:AVAST type 1 anti-phage system protease Avs1b [Stieleria tagensis]MCO8122895.1 serine protease [Stieleria tagensis]